MFIHVYTSVLCSFRLTCVKLEQGWELVGAPMDYTALPEPIKKLSDNSQSLDMIVLLKNDSTASITYLYIYNAPDYCNHVT